MVEVESNRNFPYPSLVEKNRRKQPKKGIQICSKKGVIEQLFIILAKYINFKSFEKYCLTFQNLLITGICYLHADICLGFLKPSWMAPTSKLSFLF